MGRPYDDYWPAAKKMLGDLKFLDSLRVSYTFSSIVLNTKSAMFSAFIRSM